MFDDLRNSSDFIEEEEPPIEETTARRPTRRAAQRTFLGMTALQRFVLSLLIFVLVCVLGSFALLLGGSVVLPF